jgi:glycosyltransferase involved in cell wall biosynthesis
MSFTMKIALLCSGLGNIHRGHEIFARSLFELLRGSVEITLFKGGGENVPGEIYIDNVPRNSPYLDRIHVAASPKWESSIREHERLRVETETFAHAALRPLLEGEYDIIHCLEQEVCDIVYSRRHVFGNPPRIVFSNGGAISAKRLPRCDFVQEHTDYNGSFSAKHKATVIPHGVDLTLFRPGIETGFRERHGIPEDATVAISVGSIGFWHKRMDYVIREVAPLKKMYLVIAGQECSDTLAIKEIGRQLMGERVIFVTLPHDELPQAYAAADLFILGSLFETFGIVYIEAMAMELPVFCTDHPNQKSIVKEGVFIDMKTKGALTQALLETSKQTLGELGQRGRQIVEENYDLNTLRQRYIDWYSMIEKSKPILPRYTLTKKLVSNLRNVFY